MNYQEYIRELTAAADSPKAAILASCKKNGKRAVGWVAPYAPEEIIYAAGCIPVGLWGGEAELKKARTYLPPFACSIMQSIMEFEANGTYDDIISAVVIPAPCDTLKCFGQKWKGKCPAVRFVHPQNRHVPGANEFLVAEYEHVRKCLREILGAAITDEELSDAIRLYNDYRFAMRTFTHVASEHLDVITPVVRHKIIKASFFMDKKDYLQLINGLITELRKQPRNQWSGRKVVITGITFEPEALLKVFEDYNVAVVADDIAQESRQFRTDVPFYGTPMQSLAKQWQIHEACSLAFDANKRRVEYLTELVRANDADGLVIGLMKFCDPEEYDVPIIMQACEKAGIPLLNIEIDQQAAGVGQNRTRIQAFVETMA